MTQVSKSASQQVTIYDNRKKFFLEQVKNADLCNFPCKSLNLKGKSVVSTSQHVHNLLKTL